MSVQVRSCVRSLTTVSGTVLPCHSELVSLNRHGRFDILRQRHRIDTFLPHSVEFGFFLDPHRFRDAALQVVSFGDFSRPSPAVLSAVYLWGAHLSRSEHLLGQERALMVRALQCAATDLLGDHPDAVLHRLQADVLFAYYFLRTGRFLQAKFHSSSAASLALAAGLHQIGSPLEGQSILGLSSDQAIYLPPPRDAVEERERVNGFWNVLVLHKYMMIALEPPTSVCGSLEAPGMQFVTPLPAHPSALDSETGSSAGTLRTLQIPRDNSPSESSGGDQPGRSIIAMNVQAAILLHRSAQLTGQWVPSMSFARCEV